MQGFLPILIVWVIFAFIGSLSKNAKKKTQQQAQQAKAVPAPQQAAAPARAAAQPKAPAPAAVQKTHSDPAAKPFEAHIHEPVMGMEGVGTEGMDCCHDYMLESPKEEEPGADFLPLTDEDDADKARLLLNGVIFSEVLGRRPIRRYGRSCRGRNA